MRRLLLVVLFFAPILTQSVSAQGDDEQWFFAKDLDNNAIIAYNLDGDIIQVMALGSKYDVIRDILHVWRMNSQTILLAVNESDESQSIFKVSLKDTSIIPFAFKSPSRVVAFHYPYIVFVPLDLSATSLNAVLVNIEIETATFLDEEVAALIETLVCCRFSEDGTRLRYVAKVDNSQRRGQFELRERNLNTGEERAISTIESVEIDTRVDVSAWQSDSTGDRWIIRTNQSNNEGIVRTTLMFSLDASTEVLDETRLNATSIPLYRFKGNLLWVTDERCEDDCTLDVFDEQGSTIISVQASVEYFIQRLVYVGDDHIIAETDNAFLRLTPDAAPEIIGYKDWRPINVGYQSADGRLVAMMDAERDGQQLSIYNNVTNEIIYSRQFEEVDKLSTSYRDHLFLVSVTDQIEDELHYTYIITDPEIGEAVEVDSEGFLLGDILSLDEIIVWERNPETNDRQYLIYDTETGEKSLLLEGNYSLLNAVNLSKIVLD